MRLIKLTLIIVLSLISAFSMADEEKIEVLDGYYWAQVVTNQLECTVSVNQFPLRITLEDEDEFFSGSIGFFVTHFLDSGDNQLEIQYHPHKRQPNFETGEAYCEVRLTKLVPPEREDEEGDNLEVSMLRLTQHDDGHFSVKESTEYENNSLTISPALDSENVFATREFIVDHSLPMLWNQGDKIKQGEDVKEALWKATMEVRELWQQKDYDAFKAMYLPVLTPLGITRGVSGSEYFEWNYNDELLFSLPKFFASDDFKMHPVNKTDYFVKYEGNGKVVSLRRKNDDGLLEGALVFEMSEEDYGNISLRFCLIYGELVPAM